MKADPRAKPPDPGSTLRSTPPKGILKVRSEPALGSDKSVSYVNAAYEEDEDGFSPRAAPTTPSSKPSAFSFLARAAAAGSSSGPASGHGFADVVDLLIQRTSLDSGGRDVHPFGRDCSIEGIMQASRPKSHSKNSAFSKLVIWLTLLSFLLGAAFGVIFLSETYNAKQRSDRLLKASSNFSSGSLHGIS
ncbi:uncharacterized protein LOC143290765 [Babylonia areolata]|uniref:uncharacterized protein LOC143290765 n=1 Tax=Babylonia areolata TaxID=304850 RepID=UPI003FD52F0B